MQWKLIFIDFLIRIKIKHHRLEGPGCNHLYLDESLHMPTTLTWYGSNDEFKRRSPSSSLVLAMVFDVSLKVSAFTLTIANNPVIFLMGLEACASKFSDQLLSLKNLGCMSF